ncbi:MAG: hypothetical protein UW34_C0017G0004 [Parcubacteria group bacterium GW2011_GWA2_44_15]|nr:MAG: hypothetical protein UW34_C0017G0004 [Parcubacteria group bacterium GW2011_GWA2_44_15]
MKYILRFRAGNKDIWLAIKNGKKKVETRAGTPKYQKVVVGDELRASQINPNTKTADELIKMYSKFFRLHRKNKTTRPHSLEFIIIIYSNVLKNIRIDFPRGVSLWRTLLPSERFITNPATARRRMCSEAVFILIFKALLTSNTDNSGDL